MEFVYVPLLQTSLSLHVTFVAVGDSVSATNHSHCQPLTFKVITVAVNLDLWIAVFFIFFIAREKAVSQLFWEWSADTPSTVGAS